MGLWNAESVPGVPTRHALGVWLSSKGLMSGAYLPGMRQRAKLRGEKPIWKAFNFQLNPQQTLESREACPDGFHLLAVMGSDSQDMSGVATFRMQIYDAGRKKRFSDTGINEQGMCGTAAQPFFYKRIYGFPPNSQILVRCQNLVAAANTVQIVLYGTQD